MSTSRATGVTVAEDSHNSLRDNGSRIAVEDGRGAGMDQRGSGNAKQTFQARLRDANSFAEAGLSIKKFDGSKGADR